ncbi:MULTISPECIES: glycerophosphodiester phosphodiesterase family protein [unclassified Novosphingobium]|uniref:glycerophosphodiester phosphodiesterase family protein n=1 Tax=unclassified Novosphingobium TaxID=2644732 RepID=UPI0013582FB7|nr:MULTISPECIES: glycerophosphodiester phosphodiesterase family protein [unclassified Novosphingobium]
MIANLTKAAAVLAFPLIAHPTLAAPFCGETPRIAALTREWADPRGPVMIASHRGGHLKVPENSLAAIDEAVAAGADFVEIDVQVSSDGVPFIMHDHTVDRTTNGTGKGEDLTYAQLRSLRLKGADTPPPTLLEMLMHTCGRVLVDIDMKTDHIAPVLAVIQGLGMAGQIEMFDADSNLLRAARALEPDLQVMTRLTKDATLEGINEGLSPVRIVHGDAQSLSPKARAQIQALPARIWANSLGETDDLMVRSATNACAALSKLQAMGANTIQTNYPALLRGYLAKCAARN